MAKKTSVSRQIPLCTLSLLLFLIQATSQQLLHDQEQEQEQSILLDLKHFWQSPPSISHWIPLNSSSHCSWPEITCTNDSVTGISLPDRNITGVIPPFICHLNNLTSINLTWNYIPGMFPVGLYNCTKLQYLDLSQNYFIGQLPHDIDRLINLRYLNVAGNNFTGDIPKSIGSLVMLRSLHLFQNQFNGTFPVEISDLSNLEVLEMAKNLLFLPQVVPQSFARLKKLRILWFAEANLIGEIPDMLGNMTALEHLDLSSNNLSGKIPDGLLTLKNLTVVYLHKNRLSGEIPRVVESLNMDVIDFSQNNLTGTIPTDFGKLVKLTGLALFLNQLSGEIPESIGKIQTLENFKLFSNNLTGVLPPELGKHSKLTSFEVASNRLTGTLPEYLCSANFLLGLVAFDNNLVGDIPESLGNCTSLLVVMISNNSFSGNFPSGIWSLPDLITLMISDNSLTGMLPTVFGPNLSRIEMSNNKFYGQIPDEIYSLKGLGVFLGSSNLFNGTIPHGLTVLPVLMTLLLDGNQLTGHLLLESDSWESLTTLDLSRNLLSGVIPAEISSLQVLNDLDLSENQFSGQIPLDLGFLKLTSLNLSSNSLTGKIPVEFENAAYATSFLNNPGLCSKNSYIVGATSCKSENKKTSRKISTGILAVIISVFSAACLLTLLFALFMIRLYKRKMQGSDSTWKITSFQRLNFTESNILSSLTENNLIGSGGSGKVYRVVLNRSGDVIAVKKIWNNKKLDHRLEKEFLAEIEILSIIRHSNIVKLLCCISSDNSKLLVYEYLNNQSLDKWLHQDNQPQTQTTSGSLHRVVLDWPKRLQIAIGVAQGLSYMHHDCSPAIVHRDVKSSNILLDSEFNAKIADFGLAKMLKIRPGDANTVSAVAGSLGYIAPEYAHTTRVNEKIDVYSFGVVLLELTTGREAHDGGQHTSLAEWAWRHVQDGKLMTDALDDIIKDPCYLDEMCSVFKLGIICTGSSPSTRPSMKEVMQYLLRYSHLLECKEKNSRSECVATPLLKNLPTNV